MKKITLLALVLFLQACAFTDATLDVSHNSDANFSGPIGELTPIEFSFTKLDDNRPDKDRIGWKKNGYGANTADIMTSEPVEVIIENAVSEGLTSNGHLLAKDNNGRISVSGTINRFWFETDMNFWTVEFIGDVQCRLMFFDNLTKTEIYASDYSGSYSEKKGGGLNKTWQRIMSQAVDKMVEDVVYDEDLVEALDNLPGAASILEKK